MQIDYMSISDIELIKLSKSNDKFALDAVIKRYIPVLDSILKSYFIPGSDYDDLRQEALLGFCSAVFNYNENLNTKFSTFAVTCVKRRIINTIKSANSLKNEPLNRYVSFSSDDENNSGMYAFEPLNPEEFVIDKEKYSSLLKSVQQELSDYELRVFSLYIEHLSYEDIGSILNKSPKSIDNAIQRIKKKLSKVLNN